MNDQNFKIIMYDVVDLKIDIKTGYFSEQYTLNKLNKFKSKSLGEFYKTNNDIIERLGIPQKEKHVETKFIYKKTSPSNPSNGAYYYSNGDKFLCKELYLAFVSWLRPDLYLRYSTIINGLIESGNIPK